jgi:hypothetical protein
VVARSAAATELMGGICAEPPAIPVMKALALARIPAAPCCVGVGLLKIRSAATQEHAHLIPQTPVGAMPRRRKFKVNPP